MAPVPVEGLEVLFGSVVVPVEGVVPVTPPVVPAGVWLVVPVLMSGVVLEVPLWLVPMLPVVPVVD